MYITTIRTMFLGHSFSREKKWFYDLCETRLISSLLALSSARAKLSACVCATTSGTSDPLTLLRGNLQHVVLVSLFSSIVLFHHSSYPASSSLHSSFKLTKKLSTDAFLFINYSLASYLPPQHGRYHLNNRGTKALYRSYRGAIMFLSFIITYW